MIYNFDVKCGNLGDYGEEMYVYLSKVKFNKNNVDIQFYPFELLLNKN